MPAHRVVSLSQLERLVECMEENRELAMGRLRTPLEKQAASRTWEKVALLLNSLGGGCTRNGPKWRDYWNEQKYAAKKKASEQRDQAMEAGHSHPSKKINLTDLEQRIVRLVGHEEVHGNTSVRIAIDPLLLQQPSTSKQATNLRDAMQSRVEVPPVGDKPVIMDVPVASPSMIVLDWSPVDSPSSLIDEHPSIADRMTSKPAPQRGRRPSEADDASEASPARSRSPLHRRPRSVDLPSSQQLQWALNVEAERERTLQDQTRVLQELVRYQREAVAQLRELNGSMSRLARTVTAIGTDVADTRRILSRMEAAREHRPPF